MGSDGLTCQELVELVTDYLEGTMPDAERNAFDSHLDLCPGCAHYLAQMRTTIRVVGSLREDAITVEARETLLAAFRNWKLTT